MGLLRNDTYEIQLLKREILQIKATLETLIGWMASSANSPINIKEAEILIRKVNGS